MAKYTCLVFVALALVSSVLSELVEFQECGEYAVPTCTVSDIRIDPCKNGRNCRFKKGTAPSIVFNFTPNFSAEQMRTGLFWDSDKGDVAFPALNDADACAYTSCPVEAGKKQELNYSLKLSKKLPNGKFTFKWKIWNANNKNEVCCFKTNVELAKY